MPDRHPVTYLGSFRAEARRLRIIGGLSRVPAAPSCRAGVRTPGARIDERVFLSNLLALLSLAE